MPLSGADQQYYDSLPVKGGRFTPTGRDVGGFKKSLHDCKPTAVGPESMWQYFQPNHFGARYLPDEWRHQVKAIDERLEVIWHPVRERWVVWVRHADVATPYGKGWKLVFPWSNPYDDSYLPPDERLLANIWARSSRRTDAKHYWDRIESEVWRDKRKKEEARQQLSRDIAGDYFDYRQIKNIGSGSKFAESHSE